jgi:hypothetical protein
MGKCKCMGKVVPASSLESYKAAMPSRPRICLPPGSYLTHSPPLSTLSAFLVSVSLLVFLPTHAHIQSTPLVFNTQSASNPTSTRDLAYSTITTTTYELLPLAHSHHVLSTRRALLSLPLPLLPARRRQVCRLRTPRPWSPAEDHPRGICLRRTHRVLAAILLRVHPLQLEPLRQLLFGGLEPLPMKCPVSGDGLLPAAGLEAGHI